MSHAPNVADLSITDFHAAFEACQKDRSGFATVLLMERFSLSAPDPQTGNCLIHLAAEWGDFELIKTLVQWDADPQMPNHEGEIPLTHLSHDQQTEVLNLVRQKRQLTGNSLML